MVDVTRIRVLVVLAGLALVVAACSGDAADEPEDPETEAATVPEPEETDEPEPEETEEPEPEETEEPEPEETEEPEPEETEEPEPEPEDPFEIPDEIDAAYVEQLLDGYFNEAERTAFQLLSDQRSYSEELEAMFMAVYQPRFAENFIGAARDENEVLLDLLADEIPPLRSDGVEVLFGEPDCIIARVDRGLEEALPGDPALAERPQYIVARPASDQAVELGNPTPYALILSGYPTDSEVPTPEGLCGRTG